MVIFVVRPDLYRERADAVLAFEKTNIPTYSPVHKVADRLKQGEYYHRHLMPLIYSQSLLLSKTRTALVCAIQKVRPMQTNLSHDDMRVVVHKSCGLVAMAERGLDTCPLEGFDESRVKQILSLPRFAEINMVVACGHRSDKGVWGERFRVPFDDVYWHL